MLNNSLHILWLKLRMETQHRLYLPLPIPLFIFRELFDDTSDLLTIANAFIPKKPDPNSPVTINTIKDLVQLLMKLFDSLTEGEPYTLVDVTADKINFSIKIR